MFEPVKERKWLKYNPENGDYVVSLARRGLGRLRIRLKDPTGVRPTLTKSRAIELGDKAVSEWLASGGERPKFITFEQAAKEIMAIREVQNSKSSMEQMRSQFKIWLIPFFGKMTLHAITESDWARFVEQKRRKRPGCSLKHDIQHFKMLRRWAWHSGYKMKNFTIVDMLPRVPVAKVIPQEDYVKILSACESMKGNKLAGFRMRLFIRLAYECGMRKGEIAGLDWERLNLKTGAITLHPHHTKTRSGRTVVVAKDLLGEFRRLRNLDPDGVWVFPHKHNSTKHRIGVGKSWYRLQRELKFKTIYRFHDTRHAFLTRALAKQDADLLTCKYAGVSPDVASKKYFHPNETDLGKVAAMGDMSAVLIELQKRVAKKCQHGRVLN